MTVLSGATLRPGVEDHELSGLGRGSRRYYTGAGEAPGRWVSEGAAALGLAGEVDGAWLRAVKICLAPGCGGLTSNGGRPVANARRVPGFDLTIKAPKSLSVPIAVSDDPRAQGAIIQTGESAAEAVVT